MILSTHANNVIPFKMYNDSPFDLSSLDVFLSLIQIAEESEATFESIMSYIEKIDLIEKGWEIQTLRSVIAMLV